MKLHRVLALALFAFVPLATAMAEDPPAASRAAGAPAEIAGHWDGTIQLPGQKLTFDIDFARKDDAWTGDISIPVQMVKDMELTKIKLKDRTVSFSFPGAPGNARFKGKLAEDGSVIAGDFMQGLGTFKFEMHRGATAADVAKDALAGFDAFVEKARKDWDVPGVAMAIVKDDKVVFAKGFGYRDAEQKLPVTTKTLFAIGSSTKAFTTFVMGTLADEGKMDWDKPASTYIPGFRMFDPMASQRMTPRDLVTHRAGLPRHDLVWYNSTLTLADMVARLPYLENNKDFRTDWQYNNLMFGTAGRLIELVTGGTWENAVRERIFKPLDMANSNFSVRDSQKSDDFALPYEERTDKVVRMEFRDISNVGPAGSINSCIDDMAKWVIVHLNDGKMDGKQIISANTINDMHTPHMTMPSRTDTPDVVSIGYGCGWMVDSYRGHVRVHHGGNIDGFSALVCMVPSQRIGTVILCNMNGAALPGILNRHALDRMLKLEAKDHNAEALTKRAAGKAAQKDAEKNKNLVRKKGTKPAHELKEYAGEYEHPGYGVLKVELAGDKLAMTYNRITTPMEHWHFETFAGMKGPKDHTFEDFKLMFDTDMSGDVSAVEAPFEPSVKNIVFTRRPEAHLSDPAYLARLSGDYEMAGQVVKVSVQKDGLTCLVPGQPLYTLSPRRDDTFDLKGLSGFSVKFKLEKKGSATEAQFNQPNGVFIAKRKT